MVCLKLRLSEERRSFISLNENQSVNIVTDHHVARARSLSSKIYKCLSLSVPPSLSSVSRVCQTSNCVYIWTCHFYSVCSSLLWSENIPRRHSADVCDRESSLQMIVLRISSTSKESLRFTWCSLDRFCSGCLHETYIQLSRLSAVKWKYTCTVVYYF